MTATTERYTITSQGRSKWAVQDSETGRRVTAWSPSYSYVLTVELPAIIARAATRQA